MIHERPGVWSAFGAQGTTELTDRRLAAVIAPADIRIEVAGRRVAVVQSYRVEEEASCEVVGAIGSNEPVGVVRGPARYRITLQRVYATDEAISDGLRFHDLRQFSLVIAKPDTMVVFSGCEWERLTERAEVGSSVLEEAVVLAAVRGEYEQQEG